ncbi:hypothetical protein [Streptomyces sp. NPDC007917]|uniref:hypothetical protein n=1 Tax=Streptomyces sp. NPDC007917 TaxID=3364793 RepID=UPI0036E88672
MAFAGWNIVNDDKRKSTDTATLLGVPIGVIGLVIAVMALRKPFEDNDAELARGRAGKLARQVKDSEGRVRRQLLGADILLTALPIIPTASLFLAKAIHTGDDFFALGSFVTVFAGILAYRPTPKPSRLRITSGTLRRGLLTRFWAGFMTWFAIGFTIGFTYGFVYADFVITAGIVVGSTAGLMVGLVGGLMGGLAGGFKTGFRTWFMTWFAIGATVNLHSWFADDWLDDIWDIMEVICQGGLVAGLVGGPIGGFVRGLRGEPTTVASPRAIIRDDMVYGLAIGPMTGFATVLPAAFTSIPGMDIWSGFYGKLSEIDYGFPLLDFQDAVVAGFAIGLVTGLVAGFARAARRYGVFLVCSRGKLPFRLAPFLDWAVTAGLLRYNGPAYQFRHRELQQWLAQHPRP